ncbi:hypothetical protein AB0K21_29765 [Streptosporangium sp. NPDC049248]|uniref:hypothetical protein n=1 Tax=Streptosporangium sp. NPDC049248 TaxID=3155651 RepID=UPI00343DBD5D
MSSSQDETTPRFSGLPRRGHRKIDDLPHPSRGAGTGGGGRRVRELEGTGSVPGVGWPDQRLSRHPEEQPVRISQLDAELGLSSGARLARMVLNEVGLFVDDTVSTMRLWIDRQSSTLPEGFRADVQAWLRELGSAVSCRKPFQAARSSGWGEPNVMPIRSRKRPVGSLPKIFIGAELTGFCGAS